jgi:peptide chain release factor 1
MYCNYAKMLHLKTELLSQSDGHAIITVKGAEAVKAFQHESGKHCVQRIPKTESKGRKHTSIISVAVLPLKDTSIEPINEKDLNITFQKGSGPGGQHQNTTDSAVRIKHKPTGVSVVIEGRDQHKNKKKALAIIAAKVHERKQREIDRQYSNDRKSQFDGGNRSNKIRTYNFMNNRVVDHRLGKKSNHIEKILKGNLDLITGPIE